MSKLEIKIMEKYKVLGLSILLKPIFKPFDFSL